MVNKKTVARLLAEAFGVFALTLAVLSINRYGIPFFTAIVAGVTLGGLVAMLGGVSGGHFNPAVTTGMFMLRRVKLVQAATYVLAQVVGAVAAWQLYEWMTEKPLVNSASNAFDWKIFVAEAVGAVVFTACVAHTVAKKQEGTHAGMMVGTGLFVGATISSLAAAGILNPAVALGVRSFSLEYVVGPIIGAIVGMGLYDMVFDGFMNSKATVKAVAASAPAKAVAKAKAKVSPKRKTAAKKK